MLDQKLCAKRRYSNVELKKKDQTGKCSTINMPFNAVSSYVYVYSYE